jgi:hypothetical protein
MKVPVKTLSPNAADIAQIDLAIRSFGNASGYVIHNTLWMMIPSDAATAGRLWKQAGIRTDGQSALGEMSAAREHTVTVAFHKLRRGLFGVAWYGLVSFDFDQTHVDIGAIAGRKQTDIWRQLRSFLDGNGKLFGGTADALLSIGVRS